MLALIAFLAGCSSTATGTGVPSNGNTSGFDDGKTQTPAPAEANPYEELYGPPSSTRVTSSLTGVWAATGEYSYDDYRVKLTSSSIVIARRCSAYGTTGVTLAAHVTASSIRVLESKNASINGACSLSIRPTELTASTSRYADTFELDGTKLHLNGLATDIQDLTKLADE